MRIRAPRVKLIIFGQSQSVLQTTSDLTYSFAKSVLAAGDSQGLHAVLNIGNDT